MCSILNLYETLERSLLLSSWCLFPLLSSVTHTEPWLSLPSSFSDRSREWHVTCSSQSEEEGPFSHGTSLRVRTQNLRGQVFSLLGKVVREEMLTSEKRLEANEREPYGAFHTLSDASNSVSLSVM